MKEENTSNRIEYLDVLRGLTMLMIVSFHVLGETIPIYHHFLATMVLQVFLFVSGYCFKGFDLKSNIKKLIMPYCVILILVRVVWNIRLGLWSFSQIKDLILQILLGYTIDGYWQDQSFYVGIIWFLTFLVSTRLIYAIICRMEQDNYFARGILCIVVSAAGTVIGTLSGGMKLPWSVDVAMATIIFMFAGDLAHKYKDNFEIFVHKYLYIFLLLVAWCVLVRLFDFNELATRKYPYGLTHICISLLAVIVMIMCSCLLNQYFHRLSRFLRFCGQYSMYILCAHIIDKSCITYPTGMNIYLQLIIELFVAVFPIIIVKIVTSKTQRTRAVS